MKWWMVVVENDIGIKALHYVQAEWPSTARKQEEALGFKVLEVNPWSGPPEKREGEWVDRSGSNYLSKTIVSILRSRVGSSYNVDRLERTHPVGSIYQNGDIWFQRMS